MEGRFLVKLVPLVSTNVHPPRATTDSLFYNKTSCCVHASRFVWSFFSNCKPFTIMTVIGDCNNVGNDKHFFKSLKVSDKTKVYNYVSIQKRGDVLR